VVHGSSVACGLLLLKPAGLRLRTGMSRLPAALLMPATCASNICRITGAAADGAVGVLPDVRPMASRGATLATLLVEPDAGTACRGAGEGLRSACSIETRCSTARRSCQSINCSWTLMPGPPARKGALAERVTKEALTFRGSLAATAAATIAKLAAKVGGVGGDSSMMTISSNMPSTVGMEPASLLPLPKPWSANSTSPAPMSVALHPCLYVSGSVALQP